MLLREEYTARYGFPGIVGEYTAIGEISQQIQRSVGNGFHRFAIGRERNGEELFARAVHHLSQRGEQPFVVLNCAAIREGSAEKSFFGMSAGRLPGRARKTANWIAHRGTLFLD